MTRAEIESQIAVTERELAIVILPNLRLRLKARLDDLRALLRATAAVEGEKQS